MTDYCMGRKTYHSPADVYIHQDHHHEDDCHPVLVLDPDDAEQMEALHTAYWTLTRGWSTADVDAAVRSMLTPPKIAEKAAGSTPTPDEARGEVKAAVEEWFTNVDLDDLFAVLGWAHNPPKIAEPTGTGAPWGCETRWAWGGRVSDEHVHRCRHHEGHPGSHVCECRSSRSRW